MLNIFLKENLQIKENEPLAPYTTFKIGGPAKYFLIARTAEDLTKALRIAVKNKMPFYVLGSGSNILVSDKGFDGLVVKVSGFRFQVSGNTIVAECGMPLAKLIIEAARNGLSGLEWAVGIPGTIGGAVRGNAGAYGHAIGETVEKVRVMNYELGIMNYGKEECKFNYRSSIFKQNPNLIILEVELKLKRGKKEAIEQKMKEILTQRKNKIPPFPSAGSFFKNYELKDISSGELKKRFPQATDEEIKKWSEWKKIPAAWFIEECGLKGKQIGGAKISDEHANFIINTGNAKAEDVVMLVSLIKQQVRDKYNVQLEEEIEYITGEKK